MKFIIGIINELENCAFQPASNNWLFNVLNSATLSASPLNAFTIKWLPYISSICPFTWPKYSCCLRKYFCVCFTTNNTNTKDNGNTRIAMTDIFQLINSIIVNIPITLVTEVITCVTLWFKLLTNVSSSFVMWLKISP